MAHNEDNPCLTYQIRIDDPERRHLEMMAATILGASAVLVSNGMNEQWQYRSTIADAVELARAIQKEVRGG